LFERGLWFGNRLGNWLRNGCGRLLDRNWHNRLFRRGDARSGQRRGFGRGLRFGYVREMPLQLEDLTVERVILRTAEFGESGQ
jgi:hypothetical protein